MNVLHQESNYAVDPDQNANQFILEHKNSQLGTFKTELDLEKKKSFLGLARKLSARISMDFNLGGQELKEKRSAEWIVSIDEDEDDGVRQNATRVAVIGTGWMARALVKVMAEVGSHSGSYSIQFRHTNDGIFVVLHLSQTR